MFVQNRNEARHVFFQVWQKLNKQQPLQPLEAMISDVILEHPEYHHYLENSAVSEDHDFSPEQNQSNPFLHMGMHIALKEQVSADRPKGISALFSKLLARSGSAHDIEHKMMECLGQSLWEAQRENRLHDEDRYMDCLKRIS